MYYSYKSKRKNRKLIKLVLLIAAIVGVYYFGAKYQKYIFFWKYTYNKICNELDNISEIQDIDKRILRLGEIIEICNNYNSENQISAESFFLMGKIHYILAELYLNKSFSEYIISDCSDCANQKSVDEFIKVIKNIKKGIALSGADEIDPEYHVMLAKSCYHSKYYNLPDIYSIVDKINIESISRIDDIRFLSIINILNNNEDYGIEILNKYGMISDSIKGRFFLALAYNLAGKYTDSIMTFKDILDSCSDNSLIRLANINLGKIYYNQSLYNESIVHFTNALRIDERDNELKIWIGKNYSALGEKIKAKAIWIEVLASDQTNKEAKQLLGLM